MLQQGDGAVEGLVPGLMQVVVEGRRVVEGQVQGGGLTVYQVTESILDPLRLCGANEGAEGVEALAQDQQPGEQGRKGQERPQVAPVRSRPTATPSAWTRVSTRGRLNQTRAAGRVPWTRMTASQAGAQGPQARQIRAVARARSRTWLRRRAQRPWRPL